MAFFFFFSCQTYQIYSHQLLCCKALPYDAAPSRSSQTVLKIDVCCAAKPCHMMQHHQDPDKQYIKIQSNSTEDRCLLCCKALPYDAAPSRSSQTALKIDVCCAAKALSYDAAPSRSSQTVLKIDVSAKKRRENKTRN